MIYFIPFIAAATGWILHWIYIKLFLKRIIQKKQKIAHFIGKIAANEFTSFLNIEEKINDPAHFEKLKPFVEKHIDDFLRVRLSKEMPMISMFIGDKTIDSLKKVFMAELETLFPQVIGKFAGNMMSGINVEKSVEKKIADTPDELIEKKMRDDLSGELRNFQLLGLVTGFIIGSIALLIIFLFP